MNYIPENLLDDIFEFISNRFSHKEEVPKYREEFGYEKLCGILKQVKEDVYYPDLFSKATYLLLNINKGHYFSNGNKRLSLAIATFFIAINDMQFKNIKKSDYRIILDELFPEYKENTTDFDDFNSTDFVTYNIAIIVADSGSLKIEFDDLKYRVQTFFQKSLEKQR